MNFSENSLALPPDGAQQGRSGLVVEGDDDGGWRKIRVVMKSGAPAERHRGYSVVTLDSNSCKIRKKQPDMLPHHRGIGKKKSV